MKKKKAKKKSSLQSGQEALAAAMQAKIAQCIRDVSPSMLTPSDMAMWLGVIEGMVQSRGK